MARERKMSGAWGILLAGGDGSRLQALTRMIEGDARPKQFCRVLADESLFTQTRRRISPLFQTDKVVAVVTRKHEQFYSRELADWPQRAVISQPENRGTGVAIAAAILMLRGLDPEAVVVALPCDHDYVDEASFLDVIEAAILITAAKSSDSIILVGAEATYPETEYGWIEPVWAAASNPRVPLAQVRQFWEKPNLAIAQDLLRRGCLWNTFVTIGRVSTFIDLLCQAAPNTMLGLSAAILENELDSCYRSIAPIDFSRDVLAGHPEQLVVIRDTMSGWTDLGNPHRVFDAVKRRKVTPPWLDSFRRIEKAAVG